jgi:hypothetical protein
MAARRFSVEWKSKRSPDSSTRERLPRTEKAAMLDPSSRTGGTCALVEAFERLL